MITLTPTVHERLARCGTSVHVDGLVAGADVTLWVDGTGHKITATGGGHTFTVPPLAAGAVVKAMQTTATGASPWSPEVVVEDAAVPPAAGPRLPETVGVCSHCVRVEGLVPGSRVELWLGNDLVGEGTRRSCGCRSPRWPGPCGPWRDSAPRPPRAARWNRSTTPAARGPSPGSARNSGASAPGRSRRRKTATPSKCRSRASSISRRPRRARWIRMPGACLWS